jgi:anion-transporting  ArsA/GET3 family ATPase
MERRLLIFTGKGGCGRSSLAAATALEAASGGRRVLLAEARVRPDHPGRLHGLLDAPPLGAEPSRVGERLWAVRIDAEAALRAYVLRRVRFQSLYRAAFERRSVRNTIAFFPGLKELMVLWRLRDLERESAAGRPRYDLIVFDAPSTGFILFLLQLPQIVVQVLRSGFIARDAADIYALLSDPARTQVLIVTVPEELPVLEARDLWQRLQSLPSPASAGIVLNAVLDRVRPVGPLPRALAPRAARDPVLAAIASAGGEEARLAVLHANRILARRREAFGQYLGMLRDTQAPLWSVPFIAPDPEDERAWTERLQAAVRAAGLTSALEAPA